MPTVLLIESHEDLRKALHVYLIHQQYSVVQAASLPQALQLPKSTRFDIILCGLESVKDCQEVLQKVRRKPSIPAIALSAFCTEQDKQEALEQGFNYFFSKPFDLKELGQQIATLIRGELGKPASAKQLLNNSQ